MMDIGPSLAAALNRAGARVPPGGGVLVVEVFRGEPAHQVGIRGAQRVVRLGNLRVPLDGDFILSINGEPIEDMRGLTVFLETRTRVGERAMLSYWRDGQVTDVQVVLGERRTRRRR
jgi:S1-C subfamily serine protease